MKDFDPYVFDLPVSEIIPEVKDKLSNENSIIVQAPPGAGKSTLLPLALLHESWLNNQKILMLEPRRLAARSIAMRMAEMLGENVGETVGYRIRFENKISAKTRIEVVTEGILTRMLQHDNALEGIGLVIFDEFHERSLHADLALALCRESQQVIRNDLRIMIMSATIDANKLSNLLNASIIQSSGRMYPVDIHYVGLQDVRVLPETLSRLILDIIKKEAGDILVFLPGEAEIRRTYDILKKESLDARIHPLYGMLAPAEQYAAIMPNRSGKRKIVLATSIAETSLTIEGVRIVIDSGFIRSQRFDPASGLSRLETLVISKDSADQRAGRAGRLGPGICYRMWTAATHSRLIEHRIPEIQEADLASLTLELVCWGVSSPDKLMWLTQPPKAHISQAIEVLESLGAIKNKIITPHGKQLHALACHPRIAHMLLNAGSEQAQSLACDIAALIEERDPLGREAGTDINVRLEALQRARKHNSLANRLGKIDKLSEQYRRLLSITCCHEIIDPYESGLLLAYAYPERIAYARPGNNGQFRLANGKFAVIGHKDELADEAWLAVAHMDTRDGLGKIFLASPIQPKDLKSLVEEKVQITWDSRKGGLVASKDLCIGSIVLQSQALKEIDESRRSEAIIKAIRNEAKTLLDWNESFKHIQARISSLRIWNPDENWPDVTDDSLIENPEIWLEAYTASVKRNEDFKKIPLAEALLNSLTWDMQQALNKRAPAKIEVPTGSKIQINYTEHGDTPYISVRLQEVFGMRETPKIDLGNKALVLHLLSPGYKPVQVTSDLKSFWDNTYHEVRKELQRRYPKHAWPENPWDAKAVKKGKSEK